MRRRQLPGWNSKVRRRKRPAADLDAKPRRSGFMRYLSVAAVLLIVALSWREVIRPRIYVIPFEVSPALEREGFSGRVISNRLIDRLNLIREHARSEYAGAEITAWWDREPLELRVLDTGLSLDSLILRLRGALGTRSARVSGDLLAEGPGLRLTSRVAGHSGSSFAGDLNGRPPSKVLDELLLQAAEEVYEAADPYVLAAYLYEADKARCEVVLRRMLGRPGSPDAPWAHSLWALLLLHQGRLPLALTQADLALAASPRFAAAHYTRGLILLGSGHRREAAESFRTAAKSGRGDLSPVQVGWGKALAEQGKTGEAMEHFAQAVAMNPGDFQAFYQWGVLLQRQGNLGEALRKLEMVTLLAPGDSHAYGRLAEIYEVLKEDEKARLAYQKVLELEAADESR